MQDDFGVAEECTITENDYYDDYMCIQNNYDLNDIYQVFNILNDYLQYLMFFCLLDLRIGAISS